jgi:general secretion pathway protein K
MWTSRFRFLNLVWPPKWGGSPDPRRTPTSGRLRIQQPSTNPPHASGLHPYASPGQLGDILECPDLTPQGNTPKVRTLQQKGGALLAVLWLSAALSAIAFAVATTVRTETQRTSTHAEGVRAHFLAQGSIDRALLWILWGMNGNYTNPNGTPRYYKPPMPYLRFDYPSGVVVTEVIPETARLNVNTATPEDLTRTLVAVGADPSSAVLITQGIIASRSGSDSGAPTPQQFLSPNPTFRARNTSFQETEELLLVKGMTPELFYGKFERDTEGRLIPHGGLRECLTVYGTSNSVDANTATPEMLVALGFPPEIARQIVLRRINAPFRSSEDLNSVTNGHPAAGRLKIGGGVIWTVRATARLKLPNGRLSDLARTVAATVTFHPAFAQDDPPYKIMRWRDEPWTPTVPLPF